ncbi:type II secretion system protein GspM [Candidatus Coxiella mudrowiae]|uniref:type II secretion system protein GspM n=1 Tax=Candidatus Coxiella mudrowiae TaxID=2054173 RepID=UPI0012FF2CBE|nr:type II secretion system protein GspM [Candidatus Coxiella mudrowiae]
MVITERTTLTEQKLSAYLQEVQKLESNKVTLTFHQVPFDDWMDWVQLLSKQYEINVEQLKAQRTNPSAPLIRLSFCQNKVACH